MDVGDEVGYNEDGAYFRVRIKEKAQNGDNMSMTLTVLQVIRGPFHGAKSPEVGTNFTVSEYKDAGINAGWSIEE